MISSEKSATAAHGADAALQLVAEAGRLKALVNSVTPGTIVDYIPAWTFAPPA
jgi:hypothetical protein